MRMPGRFAENARAAGHILTGGGALLLPYASRWEALVTAGVLVAITAYVLPRVAHSHIHRPIELLRGPWSGLVLYPVAIFVLLLLFPGRADIVAAAWGILAAGDGAATLVGRRVPSPRLPWNREKSLAGTIAFAVAGAAAGGSLSWWCRDTVIPPAFPWFTFGAPMAAAIAAAAVATIPVRIDGHVTVPGAAALVLFWLSLVNTDMAAAQFAIAVRVAPFALAINVAAAALGWFAGVVSRGGAVCGAVVGTAILLTTGWRGWALLFLTLAVAALTTRAGARRKSILGIEEDGGGRRGAASAFANTAVAGAASIVAAVSYATDPALVGFVAALAAAGSDTAASEIGKAFGRRTYSLTPFRAVPAGTAGAMSLEGTGAGLVAALVLGACGVTVQLAPASALVPIVAGAFTGSLLESLLAGTLEAPGLLNNAMLNFINSAVALLVAVLLYATVFSEIA